MTDNALIEELARVIEHGLAFDTERDVYASETCVEERRCIAARILPIIKREVARTRDFQTAVAYDCGIRVGQEGERKAIAKWLRDGHDGHLVSRTYLAEAIEAGEHSK